MSEHDLLELERTTRVFGDSVPRQEPSASCTHCGDSPDLLELEKKVCAFGDTVHYLDPPKLFSRCEGSYLFDPQDRPYLDLQMWYSAVNFGYANPRLNAALKRMVDTLPQLACQYLHREKIELAAALSDQCRRAFGADGRVQFNVGGSQAVEDSLKLVRNARGGKSLMFAFEGGYHGRTLAVSAITSSYRYRRRYGHFGDRAMFVPYPYCFRCAYGKRREDCDLYCVDQFARLFDTEYGGVWDPKHGSCEYAAFYVEAVQGTGGYIIPPRDYFPRLKQVLDERGVLMVDDEIQMGFFRTGTFWAMENFGVAPDVVVFGKAMTNGLNPLSGIWAREELISPKLFPPGSTHSTFSSNTLGTATALEVVRMLGEEDWGGMVRLKGAYFLDGLRELKKRHKVIGDVDGLGMALRLEVCRPDGYTPDKALTDRLVDEGMLADLTHKGNSYGLVLDVGGYSKNVLTLAPALTMTQKEMDMALDLLDQLFWRCTRR